MILGKQELIRLIEDGTLRAYRYENDTERKLHVEDLRIGPNSIDVTLSPAICKISLPSGYIACDPYDGSSLAVSYDTIPIEGYVLHPHECILGCTRERFEVGAVPFYDSYYDVVQEYVGRSTCGRMFLMSHVSAGFGDVGFMSAWTLEIVNLAPFPIVLRSGMRIGQVVFRLVLNAGDVYNGSYVNQHDKPKPPALGVQKFL